MPTKDEVQQFVMEHAPGKPETEELSNSLQLVWKDASMRIYLSDGDYITINNSMIRRDLAQALEFGTQYLMVVDFAYKMREFLTTP